MVLEKYIEYVASQDFKPTKMSTENQTIKELCVRILDLEAKLKAKGII